MQRYLDMMIYLIIPNDKLPVKDKLILKWHLFLWNKSTNCLCSKQNIYTSNQILIKLSFQNISINNLFERCLAEWIHLADPRFNFEFGYSMTFLTFLLIVPSSSFFPLWDYMVSLFSWILIFCWSYEESLPFLNLPTKYIQYTIQYNTM